MRDETETSVAVGVPAVEERLQSTSGAGDGRPVECQATRLAPLLRPSDARHAVAATAPDHGWLTGRAPIANLAALRASTSRGVAGMARVAALDLVAGAAPLDLGVLRFPATCDPSSLSQPAGMPGSAEPPPVGRPAIPAGWALSPAWPRLTSGSAASRLLEALARFERRVLGLVDDASPALREQARVAEARRLTLIHYHRLLVRELVGGLAQPTVVAAALAAGLPAYTELATRTGQRVPPVATECQVVLETLAIALGADDPETPALPLGAVLLAGASMGVPASTVAAREASFARLLGDARRRATPSGQSLASALGLDVLPSRTIAGRLRAAERSTSDAAALVDATPLPIYVLLEAEFDGDGRLGPLGSRLLAEGLLGPIRARFPERAIDPRGRLEPAGLRERDGRAIIGLVDLLRFIGAAGMAD